jgi:hypothetical protein
MKPKPIQIKPWQRMRITRREYFAARPWKKAKMSRTKYERIIMAVPQEYLDEVRITAEAEAFVDSVFGKELAEDFD